MKIIIITGPQGSGKSKLADEIIGDGGIANSPWASESATVAGATRILYKDIKFILISDLVLNTDQRMMDFKLLLTMQGFRYRIPYSSEVVGLTPTIIITMEKSPFDAESRHRDRVIEFDLNVIKK